MPSLSVVSWETECLEMPRLVGDVHIEAELPRKHRFLACIIVELLKNLLSVRWKRNRAKRLGVDHNGRVVDKRAPLPRGHERDEGS